MSSYFVIPGDTLTKVSAYGAGAPATDYYSAVIQNIKPWTKGGKKGSFQLELSFETGFTTNHFINVAHDDQGNQFAGLKDNQVKGRTGSIKSVILSAGFSNEQWKDGFHGHWLMGKTVYVEWHDKATTGGQYGDVAAFLTKSTYDKNKAEGRKPAAKAAIRVTNAPGGSATVTAPAPAAAPAPAPAPVNATSGPSELPPPPPM
ncbi:MAG: hypothetical protein Unbinned7358contig1000_32 [Prokaryotic dsDNA virus sp.]|nr:MAG: hypothetical protein Unbinned7358contig1000_32 [Prokaryotic dsDNA virus sp.]|tara:strand:+ start:46736 stop:47344 length:609 start_codon:yes stop_codon:yes gene_type:complete